MDQIQSEIVDADPFKSWWPFIIAGFVGFAVMIRFLFNSINLKFFFNFFLNFKEIL